MSKKQSRTQVGQSSSSANLIHPKYFSAWIVRFLMFLIAWLPLSAKKSLGKALGILSYKMMKGRASVGRKNLTACFPDKSKAEIEALLKQCMIEMATGAVEGPHAWWRNMKPHQDRVHVHGLENLTKYLDQGQGVLIMGGHFAAVDFIIPLLAGKVVDKYNLAYMYRPHDNPVIDQMIVNGRGRHGVTGFTKRNIKDMIQYIKDGGMCWYGCDQNFGRNADLFAPFFGVPAANISTPTWIASEANAAVVFMRMHRLPNNEYEFEISLAFEGFGQDAQKDCEAWNAELEKAILKKPAQYFWVHKRFKKRPEGMEKFY